jgi:hypothetical protein
MMPARITEAILRAERGGDRGEEIQMMKEGPHGIVAFALGTGRCGTQFLQRVLAMEPAVASHHERHPMGDAFHRYCRWYDLPVDREAFLSTKEAGIREDLERHRVSFESSAYLSLSAEELCERFDARLVLLIRSPERVVASYLRKGWYRTALLRKDKELAPGYQPAPDRPHHPFSRIAPVGGEANKWEGYTPLGKLAWYWHALNTAVLEGFERIPAANRRVIRLEDLDHPAYLALARFIGFSPTVDVRRYENLAHSRPNRRGKPQVARPWSETECAEFEAEVAELAAEFGYEWRIGRIQANINAGGNGSGRGAGRGGWFGRLLRR